MIKIQSSDIALISVDALRPHPKNEAMHPHTQEQINRLCELIKYQGFRSPIVVQKGTNLVVAGHGRLMAAKQLGMTTIPVTYQSFDDDQQLYAFLVSDNAIGKDNWLKIDYTAVNAEIENLGPDFDINWLGIKDFEIDVAEVEVKDPVGEQPNQTVCRKGDRWQLGTMTLYINEELGADEGDLIIKFWQNYTGKIAINDKTNQTYEQAKGALNGKAI